MPSGVNRKPSVNLYMSLGLLGESEMRTGILEQIWQGAIRPAGAAESKRVRRIFQAMVPTKTLFLQGPVGAARANVYQDDMELMPELALGDVLVEELSVEVPYGSLVVVCDDDCLTAPIDLEMLSFDIGVAVAKVLLGVVRNGVFPLERENEALYIMACAYDRMARSIGMQHLGLVPDEFAKGLTGTLGAYWSGAMQARTDRTRLFLGANCLASAELRSYLLKLDPAFAAPQYDRLQQGLLVFPDGNYGLQEWHGLLQAAVNGITLDRTAGMDWEILRHSKGF